MAGSVNLGYALWQDGMTFNGQLGRVNGVASMFTTGGTSSALTVPGGIIPSQGGMNVHTNSGMNITVNAGFCVVPNTTSNLQGAYIVGSMNSNTLTVSTSDPTNPRIDLVCATVSDPGTSAGFSELQMVTGTPAASPSAPAVPANSIVLAQISVPANTTTITSGLITDERVYCSVGQGENVYSSVNVTGPGFTGNIGFDRQNYRFFHNDGAAGTGSQFKTLPWAPQYAVVSSSVGLTDGVTANVANVNFTVDGNTDVKTTIKWPGCYSGSGSGSGVWQYAASITLDSAQLDNQYFVVPDNTTSGGTLYYSGGMIIYSTSSATSDTPSAGTHTMHFQMIATHRGTCNGTPNIRATAAQLAYIRVEPVSL